jgi:hypothetical protein
MTEDRAASTPAIAVVAAVVAVFAAVSCGSDGMSAPPVVEKRCGESPEVYISIYRQEDLAKLSDCTVLVGHIQEDSVEELADLAALKNVRRIEGFLNIFRSPGFVTLHGLENLETVDGFVAIHLNPNLTSIAALGKLRTITRDLWIDNNDLVPRAEIEALGARVAVGGMKTLQ